MSQLAVYEYNLNSSIFQILLQTKHRSLFRHSSNRYSFSVWVSVSTRLIHLSLLTFLSWPALHVVQEALAISMSAKWNQSHLMTLCLHDSQIVTRLEKNSVAVPYQPWRLCKHKARVSGPRPHSEWFILFEQSTCQPERHHDVLTSHGDDSNGAHWLRLWLPHTINLLQD